MALVSKVIPGLFNGISQQPSVLRLDTQCEDSLNGYATLVDGMGKRPPTEHLAILSSKASASSFTHTINRDSSEQYKVILTGDAQEPIEIYQLPLGTKCTVEIGSFDASDVFTLNVALTDYLTSTGSLAPIDVFKATTVADYTLLTNSTKVCALGADVSPALVNEAVVYIKKGVASTSYTITIDGNSVTHTTGDTTAYDTYKSTVIADGLLTKLQVAFPPLTWTCSVQGSAIRFKKNNGGDFTITVSDSWGDQASQLIKGSIQNFTDLPAMCFDGTIVEITGEPNSNFDNYWVKYETSSGSKTGVWAETIAPNLKTTLSPTTMPHKLIRSGVRHFQFGSFSWGTRQVGDDTTVPVPSYVGGVIQDIYFYKNRLGFLSGENIILSKAGEFFNYFSSTATAVLDDDPIDVAVSTNEVSTLYNAIPFNTSLLALSDLQQFQVSAGQGLLTAKTINADPTTHFASSRNCSPVGAGSNVFFASPRGGSSAIREYFVQGGSLTNDASDITAHVPQLLPKNLIKLSASTIMDVLVCLSKDDPSKLYVYKYFWSGDEKAQSAWFKWDFGGTIINMDFIETYLYVLILRGTQVCLERINMEKVNTGSLPYRVHLDRSVAVTGTYNTGTGYTTWVLPFTDANAVSAFSVIKSTDGDQIHFLTKPFNNTLVAPGNHSGFPCYIGLKYTHRHNFSEWHIKAPNSNVAIQQGRLIIRTLTITFSNTGYFRVEVTPEGRPTKVNPFNPIVLGQYYIGTPTLYDDTKRFNITAKSEKTKIELVNDSHLPADFHSGAFEGTFISRNRSL